MEFFMEKRGNDLKSEMLGSVQGGSLKNGKLIPFYGKNYRYFDINSYFGSRAFTSDVVKEIILASYSDLHHEIPNRFFYLMELSNEHGGKIYPHRTHQNGLSADFMMPKSRYKSAFYGLDTLGANHYSLDFDNKGRLKKDTSIQVDFNLTAQHILILEKNANKNGYSIGKVIIKIEYKDELFASEFGKLLKNSGIYVVKQLTPIVNQIHDDHYHVDFVKK
jgi:penicillin-insensitive murein endopeptidase